MVRWHHEPQPERRQKVTSEDAHELIDVVILANWAVNDQKFGFSGHESPDKPSDALLARLNLNPGQIRSFVQRHTKRIKNDRGLL